MSTKFKPREKYVLLSHENWWSNKVTLNLLLQRHVISRGVCHIYLKLGVKKSDYFVSSDLWWVFKDYSGYGLSQWMTKLYCNVFSHLLSPYPEWSLRYVDTMSQLHDCHAMHTLQWRHNEHDGVSNHQPHVGLLNHLFRRRSKKTSKLLVIGLCAGNWPVTGEFPAQRASNAENVSIWWCHHAGGCSEIKIYELITEALLAFAQLKFLFQSFNSITI